MIRPTNKFASLSDADLIIFALQMLAAMTGSAFFMTPVPSFATVQSAITDFQTEVDKGKGSSFDAALKNQKRNQLIALMLQLTRYVDLTANGDPVIIMAAALSVTKTPSSRPPVEAVTNLQGKDGPEAGQVALSFDRQPSAQSYMYQFTPDPLTADSVWQTLVGTTSKTVISNLQSGRAYWFRVVAVGKNNQGVSCAPIKRIAQ